MHEINVQSYSNHCFETLMAPTRVLLVGDLTDPQRRRTETLRAAGYEVDAHWLKYRLGQCLGHRAVELAVIDGSRWPWCALELVEDLRLSIGSIPIVLLTTPDRMVNREAIRLAVDTILPSDCDVRTVLRAVEELSPVMPEFEPRLAS